MDIRLLDGFSAHEDGVELDLGGRKPRTLLALLAAAAPTTVPVDRCIQAIWGEDAPSGAKRSLQTYVSSLRAAIDPNRTGKLAGTDDGYRLVLGEGDACDLDRFRDGLSKAGAMPDPTERAAGIKEALNLWGDPLGDLAYDDWAQPHIREWNAERLAAIEEWVDAHVAAGTPGEVIADLERFTVDYPLNEDLTARLMVTLYQTGRQTDALERYRALRERMGEDLGVEPSPELQGLEERILLHDATLTPQRPTPTNLPAATRPTIERDTELETLDRLLETTRLLTITGSGGTGKTTTAQSLGARRLHDHPDGVWWVGLAGFTDASVIPNEILGSMRLAAPIGVPVVDTLLTHLANSKTLIVFDNCEHLIHEVGDLIERILRRCPDVRVVATSREQLSLAGEVSWRLPPLALPPPDGGGAATETAQALRLFALRASEANPDFRITDDNVDRVASICRRLDGLPLAIELAAARLSTMGLGELEGRLDDRMTELDAGQEGEPHQRTLGGTVQWSYDLLTSEEREVYRSLAVFRGGFDVGAVEAVSGSADAVRVLDSLVTQSLVSVDHTRTPVRYRMLEPIRQHAWNLADRHGELGPFRRAHLDWVASLASEGARHLEGPDQQAWVARFRLESDNLRAALALAEETDPVTGAAVAAGLARFWWLHAMERDPSTLDDATSFLEEGQGWATRLLVAAGDDLPPKVRARLLTALGGLLEIRTGRLAEAIEHLDAARETWRTLGDQRNEGWAQFYRGCAAWGSESAPERIDSFDLACRLHDEAEDRFGLGFAKLMRGFAYACAGDFDPAAADFGSFMELAESVRNPNMLAHAEDAVACLAVMADRRTEEDKARIVRALQRFRRLSNNACIAHGIHTGAAWLAADGQLEQAARCLGIVQAIRDRLSMVIPPYEDRTFIVEAAGLADLEAERRAAAFLEGRSMEPADGIEWVLEAIGQISE